MIRLFPVQLKDDKIQRFVVGAPPTLNAAAEAVRHADSSRSIYVYNIAGDLNWFRASAMFRAVSCVSLTYQTIVRLASERDLWMNRKVFLLM